MSACEVCGWNDLLVQVREGREDILRGLLKAKAENLDVPGWTQEEVDAAITNLQCPEHEARYIDRVLGR